MTIPSSLLVTTLFTSLLLVFGFLAKNFFRRQDEHHAENRESLNALVNRFDELRDDYDEKFNRLRDDYDEKFNLLRDDYDEKFNMLNGQIQHILGRLQIKPR